MAFLSDRSGRFRQGGGIMGAAAGILAFSLGGGGSAKAEYAPGMRLGLTQPVSLTESATAPPTPQVLARVDLSDQRMEVFVDDTLVNVFPVSSGRMGYGTPPGEYRAQFLAARWRSRKYNWAPMPYSVFFHGGYAIHGTTDIRNLGRPASHGCIRLNPENAKIFFALVLKNGRENTAITIVR